MKLLISMITPEISIKFVLAFLFITCFFCSPDLCMNLIAVDFILQPVYDFRGGSVCLYFRGDFITGVHHCGMVPASKGFSDLRKGSLGHFPAKIHGDLPWKGQIPGAFRGFDVRKLDIEIFADDFFDGFAGNREIAC